MNTALAVLLVVSGQSYSGVGQCPDGQVIVKLNRNAPPTCRMSRTLPALSATTASSSTTADRLSVDPTACGVGLCVSDVSASGVLTCSLPPRATSADTLNTVCPAGQVLTSAGDAGYSCVVPSDPRIGSLVEGHFCHTADAGVNCDGTRWTDLMVPGTSFKTGVTAPTFTTYTGGVLAYSFAAGDQVYFAVQMPHGWKIGSTIKPHIHVSFPDTGAGSYVFGLEYAVGKIGSAMSAATTIESSVTAAPGAALTHALVALPDITMTSYDGLSTMLVGRIYRKSGVASAYASGIFLLQFDFHYELDTNGSREATTK